MSLMPLRASAEYVIATTLSPMPMKPVQSLPSAFTNAVAGYMPTPKIVLVMFSAHALPAASHATVKPGLGLAATHFSNASFSVAEKTARAARPWSR